VKVDTHFTLLHTQSIRHFITESDRLCPGNFISYWSRTRTLYAMQLVSVNGLFYAENIKSIWKTMYSSHPTNRCQNDSCSLTFNSENKTKITLRTSWINITLNVFLKQLLKTPIQFVQYISNHWLARC